MMHFNRAAALVLTFLAMSSPEAIASPTLPLPPPRMHAMIMPPQESSLTVTGEGVVSKAPDEAKLTIRIVTDDANATMSVSKNNDIRKALQSLLSFLNGNRYDVFRETGYSVEFIPFPAKNTPPEQRLARYGYVTTRSLVVTVLPIDLVGRAIDAATAAGVTSIGDVSFDIKDRHAASLGALSAAMNDAKQQADAIASAGSFHIVGIRTVSTGYNALQVPAPMAGMMQMRRAESAPLTPTELMPGGPIEVNARVTITYAIK
jgi:uncharacterized protein YggE